MRRCKTGAAGLVTRPAAFAVLAILGIVAVPTTEGLQDSDRAMTYTDPWSDVDVQ